MTTAPWPRRGSRAALLAVGIAVVGCTTDPDVRRHDEAMARLDGGLASDLDRLLLRWTSAQDEGNVHQQSVAEARIRQRLGDADSKFAVRVGLAVTDEAVLATCAAAAGFTGDVEVMRELVRLFGHSEPAIRANAVLGAVVLGGVGCPLPSAMKVLGDADVGVRRHAAVLATLVTKRHASDPGFASACLSLVEALSDADPVVRSHVAEGLGAIGDAEAAPHLVRQGLRDPVPQVRYAAARALAAIKPASEAEAIVAAGKAEFNEHVKAAIVAALRAITGKKIVDMDEWEKEVRGAAAPPPPPPPAAKGDTAPAKPSTGG